MKDRRIKNLKDCMFELEEAKKQYRDASPAWTLIHAAKGFIKSVYHLEAEANFDEETLGVRYEETTKVQEK